MTYEEIIDNMNSLLNRADRYIKFSGDLTPVFESEICAMEEAIEALYRLIELEK